MTQFLWQYWGKVRKNPEVFLVGFLSISFILVAILFHYLVNQKVEPVMLLLIAFLCAQGIAVVAFPDFVNTKKLSIERIRWFSLILHAIRMCCLVLALWLYPSDWQSEFLVILSFFIVFDVFLVGLPQKLAIFMLLANAMVLALLYTQFFAVILFIVVAGAQMITYFIQKIFRKMIDQQNELIQLNAKIDQISTEAERLRLKGDLHDTLGHELTALTLQVSMMQEDAQGDDAEKLASLQSRIKGLNHALRRIIENRHTSHDMTMQDIIRQQIRRLPRLRVKTELSQDAIMLTPQIQKLVVSGVLELLTNCLKYGVADDVSVGLTLEHGQAVLNVDNAVGDSENSALVSSSMGLKMLSERLRSVEGELSTEMKESRFYAVMTVPCITNTLDVSVHDAHLANTQ